MKTRDSYVTYFWKYTEVKAPEEEKPWVDYGQIMSIIEYQPFSSDEDQKKLQDIISRNPCCSIFRNKAFLCFIAVYGLTKSPFTDWISSGSLPQLKSKQKPDSYTVMKASELTSQHIAVWTSASGKNFIINRNHVVLMNTWADRG